MNWLALITALIIMLAGLAGTVIPLLPGAPLIILGIVVYGLIDGFEIFSTGFWIGQAVLLILVFAVDYLAGAVGAKYYGGTKASVWGSIIGGLVGLLTLGPLGVILGPFLGAVTGELIARQPFKQAVKSGIGTLIGFAGGAVVKMIIEMAMIAWFLLVIF
ncbi:uncharacterized protein YqgC (DUF456 family) [Desulfohalotomaculum tongense]|uniref:DUF456 domain-containing protein n=1 Tax=Desulforadius tongensis TaxID=1216062 RepID=UPI00195F1DA9|nr:DUF456 family protein [Desulforadius tongensis]MBM7854331.1 uncharacterized protein YqgC (DUF456 family) [Desulforadius tongensis]